ncbi:CHAD domain-containing protein [Ancylothrix sp. C2]|uniref:CHAD domain-containing protein n=1 Tax=Ancylothrix sp. D3o TaxID=2953691 RepID=UPI0021BB7C51|nr:CHAD domain-containing protein [Ancylothrix sp. D3o]MCT7950946.1 CHAD domain-containing protein [Ancylothrix sp. D3o]
MKATDISNAQTLGDWAYLAIEKHFQKTLDHEAAVMKDTDPEELHQMRVGMRRLRSAITGFSSALQLPKAAAEENIGKIARRLGELRDLDVLIEALQMEYKPHLPEQEQENLDTIVEVLIKQRRKVFNKVYKTLNGKTYQKLKNHLKNWLDKPAYSGVAEFPVQLVLPDLLAPQISRLLLHPGWLVGGSLGDFHAEPLNDAKPTTIEAELAQQGPVLHSLRKQVKRVRYQMSLFTKLYGEEYEEYVEDMKDVQEVLGNIQDSLVLAEMLSEILDNPLENELPTLAKNLTQSRQKAWEKWQPLQQRYLTTETRKSFHLSLVNCS